MPVLCAILLDHLLLQGKFVSYCIIRIKFKDFNYFTNKITYQNKVVIKETISNNMHGLQNNPETTDL